jgi:acyl dehydratase
VPLNRDFIGRRLESPDVYEVGREKIRDFADAIGDPNPAYRDVDAAKALGHPEVVAPPTFAIIVSMRVTGDAVFDPELGLNYALVVHGEQRFVHHRPIRHGDRLRGTSVITDIRDAGRNELLTLETELRTDDGELVCTAYNTIVSRGTAAGGEG